jgi:hypothetical protein
MKESHKADSAEKPQVKDRPRAGRAITMRYAEVNGIKIAFDIRGCGPTPGTHHRLSSQLARMAAHIIESARRASIVPDHEVNPGKGSALCYTLIRRRGGFLREFCGKYRSRCLIDLARLCRRIRV